MGMIWKAAIIRQCYIDTKYFDAKGLLSGYEINLLRETAKMKDKAKKVGVMNLQHSDNPGAVLIAYSLQEIIKKSGHEPKIINYNPRWSVFDKLKTAFYEMYFNGNYFESAAYHVRLLYRSRDARLKKYESERKKNFKDFRQTCLDSTPEILRKISESDDIFDIYVVGSDMVWSPIRLISFEKNAYFLKFVSNDKVKIAYAASLGSDNSAKLKPLSKKYARKTGDFDYISLREISNVPFFGRLTTKQVEHCLDPTLLLEKDDYEKIMSAGRKYPGPFIYLYTLSDSNRVIGFANELSEKLDCGIYHSSRYTNVINKSAGTNDCDGPMEFLEKIKNAETIITNSYHGVIFSIIFQKNFYAFSRKHMDSRTLDLLELLSLSRRFIGDGGTIPENTVPIDYKDVYDRLEKLKKRSAEFLERALGAK